MILKTRQIPLTIQKLQALMRRLPTTHPKFAEIKDDLAKRLAGYSGEQSIDYPLSFLPDQNYSILHDIRLFYEPFHFQIDTIVISKEFILLIEVKNISGQLLFDQDYQQLIRTKDGVEEVFPDPILQLKRHGTLFEKWLKANRSTSLPIATLVVISNPFTLIRSTPENRALSEIVIHRDVLPEKINLLNEKYPKNMITDIGMKQLGQLIKKRDSPLDPRILEKYQISPHEIAKGVQCPDCSFMPLKRTYGSWHCSKCSSHQKDAHLLALKDYALLLGTTITNKQARNYLHVSSETIVKKLLQKASQSYEGSTKARVYDITHLRNL
jgi:ribosomal protein L37AE/L43A